MTPPAKPAEIFDRDFEWSELVAFARRGPARPTLGVVSGRRRQGKTYLLDALCRALGGFYFAAVEGTEAEALRQVGDAVARYRGERTPYRLETWDAALDLLLSLGAERPVPVVVDEFPYLVRSSPALPSMIQRALGPGRPPSRVRLLLCGSALSFMGSLLSGSAPLRGRAGLELLVRPFDYRQAAHFWGLTDPRLAALTHAVVGGTPAYGREFTDEDAPADLADFGDWVVRAVLNPARPLFREARYLLAEEPDLRDSALYHAVLAAIAHGNATRGGIANYLGRRSGDLAHPLTMLEDVGLITREADLLHGNRSWYRIAEPLVTFYEAVMRPDWSNLEHPGRAAVVWERARERFSSKVMGPHFEELCRTWARWFASEDAFGGRVAEVGTGTVNDAENRTQHEIDVVVTGFGRDDRPVVLSLGEAKWNEPMGVGHLDRLRRVRDLMRRNARISLRDNAVLACYSAAGFSDALRAEADRSPDVLLVDLEKLYGES